MFNANSITETKTQGRKEDARNKEKVCENEVRRKEWKDGNKKRKGGTVNKERESKEINIQKSASMNA